MTEGSSEFHEKSAKHYREKAQRPLSMENQRRMDELTAEWHEDRAQRARVREEEAKKRESWP